jgi:hypothetical protein
MVEWVFCVVTFCNSTFWSVTGKMNSEEKRREWAEVTGRYQELLR